MIKIGVSLVNTKTGEELQHWKILPELITYNGEDRSGAIVGAEIAPDVILVDRYCEETPFGNPPILSEKSSFDGEKIVVEREYGDPDLTSEKQNLVNFIKAEASNLILAYCPQYKQANLTAQAAELALMFPSTSGADMPSPYKEAWEAGQIIWNHIKAIRIHSNVLEQEILSINSAEELKSWQPHDWPNP